MDKITERAGCPDTIRINKYLSDAGVCSRREADRLIEDGRITVNGVPARNGIKVGTGDLVELDGRKIKKEEKRVLLLFNKPRGIVCSTKKQKKEITVTEYLNYPVRIYPIGRLDKESEGLLLMTNQGDLVNRIMRAGNWHEKEYIVTVDKPVTDHFIDCMGKGVPILDTITRPCMVTKIGERSFRIILTQGLNRQIRRMCAFFGYQVISLKRVRIMNLQLQGILPGEYREITCKEWQELQRLIKNSSNETKIITGGSHGGQIHTANEKADRKAKYGSKGILSGRQGDHQQQRVRRTVRPACGNGERNGNSPCK